MLIQQTFEKDIFRPIDPVVKANSTEHLANELEEFVVTNEVERHLLTFFEEYNDPSAVGNGAWISGFFGSGKSHLLKILAVILENREVAGKGAMEYVLPKVAHNPSLKGAMEVSIQRHPSESVLFNIDSIAPNQGKSDSGALLAAFIKAFNAHCGYFEGDQQHIAKFEYDLDREGKLEEFKGLVELKTGKPWTDVRKAALLNAAKITEAFDEVLGNPPGTTENAVSYYQKTYSPDIRSFAQRVKEYVDAHEKGFRLNFFVDEVGQFIAQNTNLMVNLQSVAEELNSVCGGDSWVVVTSQEDMDSVVGQMKVSNANDFSKIQARFNIRMTLSSSDATTVIKNRLLDKKEEYEPYFLKMWDRYHEDFGVLFDFADGAKRFRNFTDFSDFEVTYPFVSYQFDLFMNSMRGLSDHSAFTGRHNSVGARSMLGVFQDVAQTLAKDNAAIEEGRLASFDMMFEGLRNSLRSEVYAAISQAEANLDDECAIRTLKALLLVKYLEDFKATPGNLRVLLYGSFLENTAELDDRVRSALTTLESQLYVRRNDNEYEYLTNEEKEIESEIRNTEVTDVEIRGTVDRIFREVMSQLRATYKNGAFSHAYRYNLKIDGEAQGQQREDLTVDVLTAYSAEGLLGEDVPTLPKTLTIKLNGSDSFMRNVRAFVQTQRYANLHGGSGEVREAIIADKRQANNALYKKLIDEMGGLLTNASYNAGGVDVTQQVKGSGKDTVDSAVLELIKRSYTGLQQLGAKYTDSDIYQQCVANALPGAMLPEFCETMLGKIGLLSSAGAVTVTGDGTGSLTGYFAKHEYGWPEDAVRSGVAQLFAANRIEVKKAGKTLSPTELAEALRKKADLDKLVVEKVDAIAPEQLDELTRAYKTLTGTSAASTDPKVIAQSIESHLEGIAKTVGSAPARNYPFAERFAETLRRVESARDKLSQDWKWATAQFPQEAEQLAEDVHELNAMASFANGSPMEQNWSALKDFLTRTAPVLASLGIDDADVATVREVVNDPRCYLSGRIPDARKAANRLSQEAQDALGRLREKVASELADTKASFEQAYPADGVSPEALDAFEGIFEAASSSLASEASPAAISGFVEAFKAQEMGRIISLLTPPPRVDPNGGGGETDEPPKRLILMSKLRATGYPKPMVEDEADADAYLAALRAEIMAAIERGDIIGC